MSIPSIPETGKERCSGCGACAAACPKQAISMCADRDGFFYPQINAEQCIQCRRCAAVCPVDHPPKLAEAPVAYAAFSKDRDLRRASSSGGVFGELARVILERGGVVVGAAIDADGLVRHRVVETSAELAPLFGSKYLQSEAWRVYPTVLTLLEAQRTVLFVGTPCQIAGLRACLPKSYENLYLVDFICHGVPSPRAWRAYCSQREELAQSEIVAVNFRDKANGWQNYQLSIRFANENTYRATSRHDPYMRAFLQNAVLRPSCCDCAAKGAKRASDLTLADFWGVANVVPQIDYTDGVSLVLVNDAKGETLLNACGDAVWCEPVKCTDALAANPSYAVSSVQHPERANFFAALESEPFDAVAARFCPVRSENVLRRLLSKLKRSAMRILKR